MCLCVGVAVCVRCRWDMCIVYIEFHRGSHINSISFGFTHSFIAVSRCVKDCCLCNVGVKQLDLA